MKEIQLTQGYVTVIDDEDYEWVSQYNWHAKSFPVNPNEYYARRMNKIKDEYLHKVLIGAKKGEKVDHINHNTIVPE